MRLPPPAPGLSRDLGLFSYYEEGPSETDLGVLLLYLSTVGATGHEEAVRCASGSHVGYADTEAGLRRAAAAYVRRTSTQGVPLSAFFVRVLHLLAGANSGISAETWAALDVMCTNSPGGRLSLILFSAPPRPD